MSDERIKKSPGDDKASRALDDRAHTENREISDSERAEQFRAAYNQSHLPNLPMIPGYHLCWLTTTNPNDPISQRLRLGYELVHINEVPGFESHKITNGEYSSFVGVNEMIAAKLPMDLYNLFMSIAHSERPKEEEDRMNNAIELIKEEAAKRGLKIKEGADADSPAGWGN
jgi:hypothetical protein